MNKQAIKAKQLILEAIDREVNAYSIYDENLHLEHVLRAIEKKAKDIWMISETGNFIEADYHPRATNIYYYLSKPFDEQTDELYSWIINLLK